MSCEVKAIDTRDEWLEARRRGIGASDAAAVLGVSKWKSPLVLYCEKLGIRTHAERELEALEWGLALEAPIAARYMRETGRVLAPPEPYTIRQSSAHPFMLATLDRVVLSRTDTEPVCGECDGRGYYFDAPANVLDGRAYEVRCDACAGPGVLEIKTTSHFRADEWTDEPPLAYQVQVQHQLAVTGYTWASLAVLVGGNRFFWMDVERDDRFIDALIAREREFWTRVENQDPPEPDGSEACRQLLAELYKHPVAGKVVALDGAAMAWDLVRREAAASIEVLETNKREAENRLKAALGDAEWGLLPDGTRYSYREQHRKSYVVPEATFRVLRRHGARPG